MGGTTDGGDGPSATGSNTETPPPLVRRKGAPRSVVRVDFFTGDLFVWEAGVRRETAPRLCLFEPPPLVVYESCTLRSRESAPATEIVAAATAAPSPECKGAGVDRLHGGGDGERAGQRGCLCVAEQERLWVLQTGEEQEVFAGGGRICVKIIVLQ